MNNAIMDVMTGVLIKWVFVYTIRVCVGQGLKKNK